jgi:hypothetical protein
LLGCLFVGCLLCGYLFYLRRLLAMRIVLLPSLLFRFFLIEVRQCFVEVIDRVGE